MVALELELDCEVEEETGDLRRSTAPQGAGRNLPVKRLCCGSSS